MYWYILVQVAAVQHQSPATGNIWYLV